ncbi:MAG: LamG-like jellyroll fold domain-containing protein, partial [Pseudomonadota bacterium]
LPPPAPPSTPFAHWQLNEAAGPAVNIGTLGTIINGSYTGGVTRSTPGLLGAGDDAAAFDGVNDYIDIPSHADINTAASYAAKSVELWFRADTLGGRQVIYEQGGGTNGLNIFLDGNTLNVGVWASNNGQWLSTGIAAGLTYYVVLVYDGAGNTMAGYLNGASIGTANPGFAAIPAHTGLPAIGATRNATRFSNASSNNGDGEYFDGVIDEVKLYNGVLTPGQVIGGFLNFAPVNTVPGPQSTAQDSPLVFLSANSIAVSDFEASTLMVTVSATNGTLTLNGTTGLAFSTGDGDTDATTTFTGAVSSINAALNGLSFIPNAGFSGAATLTLLTNDQGIAGSGGPQTDMDTVNITVNAAPVVTVAVPVIPRAVLQLKIQGEGTVTSRPSGLNCTQDCIQTFNQGVLALEALPSNGWRFDRWEGDCANTGNPGLLELFQNKTCTAIFLDGVEVVPQPRQLQFTSSTYTIDEAGQSIEISVSRSGSSDGAASVDYSVSAGSANASEDYTAVDGVLNWGDGDSSTKTLTVNIQEDELVESVETINLQLSNPTGDATLGNPASAVLVIVDNDLPPIVQVPTLEFAVTLNQGQAQTLSFGGATGTLQLETPPDAAVASVTQWMPSTGELVLTGVAVGTTQLLVGDSGDSARKFTVSVTVIGPAPVPTLEFSISLNEGETDMLSFGANSGTLILETTPDIAVASVDSWTPEDGHLVLTGIAAGETQIVLANSAGTLRNVITLTVLKPILSCASNAVVFDSQSNILPSSACFENTLRSHFERRANHSMFANANVLNLDVRVAVDPAHIGQPAELLVVANYHDLFSSRDYMRLSESWQHWDGEPSSLRPAVTYTQLPAEIDVPIHLGGLNELPGEFNVYVAYRMADGSVVFNGIEPLRFFVGNASSISMNGGQRDANFMSNPLRAASVFNTREIRHGNTRHIAARIQIDAEHVGQAAELLVGVVHAAQIGREIVYLHDGQDWVETPANAPSLSIFDTFAEIPESIEFRVNVDSFSNVEGDVKLYFGYRLSNGDIIFNGLSPFRVQ